MNKRGSKEARTIKAQPVEQYRKNIGKEDVKKGKREAKLIRKRKDEESKRMGIYEVVLMLVAFLVVVAGIYGLLYIYIPKDKIPDVKENVI